MSVFTSTKPTHLEPSNLGTREYWDALYLEELANYAEDMKNEGTIWFDDSSAEDKLLEYLEKKIIQEKMLGEEICRENCSFLDLGTGNGHFLFSLRGNENNICEQQGWNGRMLGVDFSEKSIEFARCIRAGKDGKEIEFKCWDIMTMDPSGIVLEGANTDGWDIVLDKGTFDAISLSNKTNVNGQRMSEGYRDMVAPLIKIGGIFLITSCNWTEEELKSWFCSPELAYVDAIQYRSFSFGGRRGQAISSVCFRKQ